jgi:hypothetical protein
VGIGVDELDLFARWWEFQQRACGTRAERKALEVGEPAGVQAVSFAQALSNVWLGRGEISPATERRLDRWIRFDG